MAIADRTISFRAPGEFGERLRAARSVLPRLSDDVQLAGHVAWEFELELLRRLAELDESQGDGAFVRTVMEALVVTTERAERDRRLGPELEAFAREDTEGDAWRTAALKASALSRET